MLRYGLLGLQVVFVGTSLYFIHSIVTAWLGVTPVPEPSIPAVGSAPERDVSMVRFEVIAKRNLFDSKTFEPVVAVVEPEEKLEETKIRAELVATAAAEPPELSLAAVIDLETNDRLLVRPGDILAGAQVERVERRRLVLNNRGKREALTLEDEKQAGKATRAKRNPPRRTASKRPRRGPRKARADVAGRVRDLAKKAADAQAKKQPAEDQGGSILTQARMLPSYDDDGQLVGLKLSGIKAGSRLAVSGFEEGDVVLGVGGTQIESPAQGLRVLREIRISDTVEVEVDRAGQHLTIDFAPGES